MSKQKFSSFEREAIWEAHGGKCAYTGKLLDLRDMELDHIIPERLARNEAAYQRVKERMELSEDFNIFGY